MRLTLRQTSRKMVSGRRLQQEAPNTAYGLRSRLSHAPAARSAARRRGAPFFGKMESTTVPSTSLSLLSPPPTRCGG